MKVPGEKGGQAGVVAAPACVLDWDSRNAKTRRRWRAGSPGECGSCFDARRCLGDKLKPEHIAAPSIGWNDSHYVPNLERLKLCHITSQTSQCFFHVLDKCSRINELGKEVVLGNRTPNEDHHSVCEILARFQTQEHWTALPVPRNHEVARLSLRFRRVECNQ